MHTMSQQQDTIARIRHPFLRDVIYFRANAVTSNFRHFEPALITTHSPHTMAFVERQASSSRPRAKPQGRGKGPARVKSNVAKRDKTDSELNDLQNRIDSYVGTDSIIY